MGGWLRHVRYGEPLDLSVLMSDTLRLPRDSEQLANGVSLDKPEALTVACYTFPHYHRCSYNDRLYAPGWTEYQLARGCRPWFEGHHQPRTPLLGELDERAPDTWGIYNALAADHGVDVFIWDCYWFDGQPALHEALDEGFLGAANLDRLRFAVMWTNHIWPVQYPVLEGANIARHQVVARPPETAPDVWRSLSYLVSRYLHHPRYWRIDDRPVLVIWSADQLVATLGRDGATEMLVELRHHAQRLGHHDIHIHTTQGSQSTLRELEELGFDSYGLYNPILIAGAARPEAEELADYEVVAADVVRTVWPSVDARSSLQCFPSVSPGWDTSPRYFAPKRDRTPDRKSWPGLRPIVIDETPAAFEAFVRSAFAYLNARPSYSKVLTIGCWNEWTEGQYLLPDTRLGYGMIRALGAALGRLPQELPGVSGLDVPAGERFPLNA